MSSLVGPAVRSEAGDQSRPPAGPPQVGVLGRSDHRELLRLVDADPLVNAVLGARLEAATSMEVRSLGGRLLGLREHSGALRAAALDGGNLVLVGDAGPYWPLLVSGLARRSRVASSVVGRAGPVADCWRVLEARWGPARAIRAAQPLLACDAARLAPVPPDRRVRPVREADLDAYLPAAAAMFTEELGVSPLVGTTKQEYRHRVRAGIRDGRAFGIRDEHGAFVFKADLGAVSAHTCQVQGVWVHPQLRGRGLATPALAAVLHRALRLAPTVSLYVNDFNLAARRVYDRLGMTEEAVLSTVLL